MSEIVEKLVCPKCQGEEFLEGPHGGAAVMVKCKKCGNVLNIAPLPNRKIWIL